VIRQSTDEVQKIRDERRMEILSERDKRISQERLARIAKTIYGRISRGVSSGRFPPTVMSVTESEIASAIKDPAKFKKDHLDWSDDIHTWIVKANLDIQLNEEELTVNAGFNGEVTGGHDTTKIAQIAEHWDENQDGTRRVKAANHRPGAYRFTKFGKRKKVAFDYGEGTDPNAALEDDSAGEGQADELDREYRKMDQQEERWQRQLGKDK
jgi:hypothetical protein